MRGDGGRRWGGVLGEGARDDQFLSGREKVARVLAMLPLSFTALLWVSVRPYLAISTVTSVAVLTVWFLAWTGVLAMVVVRTRQRARARRRAQHRSTRRAGSEQVPSTLRRVARSAGREGEREL